MIQIENITFGYNKKKPIFENLSLHLKPGFIYGLLGKNGAGKSTLLKQISGMAYPKEGKVNVAGFEASERNPEMLKDIYVIPEEFELPAVKINTFIKINSQFYPKFNEEQFLNYLNEFELDRDLKVSTLSYGQKKKFLIAFGLATNARLLILDEPTNGLDIPSKSQFRKIIATALDEQKLIIISTHQVRDLENLIDSIVVLEHGKIIFNKSISEISERMLFEHNLSNVSPERIIYSEELSGKNSGIILNTSGIDGRVDLELLFNGVVKSPELINEHLKNS
ncbi:MAG: ABC transporter ATP-binding protein [Bacteroidetes bacterium]|nr:ABC transporter ATP-binding protein [Bacteroidota bacterium]